MHTAASGLLLQTCVSTKAFDVALEALQRAHEIGLQFFRADAYYAVMKGAVLNQQLDVAIRYSVLSTVQSLLDMQLAKASCRHHNSLSLCQSLVLFVM